ncbi:MAG TPA: L,D-transpeptidase [Polyangiaceae bacterium]|nr:L,D-transpeptidase [Polyangiaceae bacterium]
MRGRIFTWTVIAVGAAGLFGCHGRSELGPTLSKQTPTVNPTPQVFADGPRLGSIANVTPILERPEKGSKLIGYLHAGSTVARATALSGSVGCPNGWYAVYPRGFVCVGESASLDPEHPTLLAMATQPKLDANLPYTYARTRDDTPTWEASADQEGSVRALADVPSRSGLAVIGSWQALDEEKKPLHLAMMTDGRFIDTNELEAARLSEFKGITLDEAQSLPVAFVVKRGVNAWQLDKDDPRKAQDLSFHYKVALDGKSRTVQKERFWAIPGGKWIRQKDVTVIQSRSDFPDFVQDGTHWVDISVLAGTAVMYEGKRPVYATLVSVGEDRMGDPNAAAATIRGDFPITFKHITAVGTDARRFADGVEMHDVPWALELSSGQWLHGAYWHDRFGLGHGPGNIQFSPYDAAHLWHWAGPALPQGWHGIADDRPDAQRTMVSIHK